MNDHLNTRTRIATYERRIQDLETRVGRLVQELAHARQTANLQRIALREKDVEIERLRGRERLVTNAIEAGSLEGIRQAWREYVVYTGPEKDRADASA